MSSVATLTKRGGAIGMGPSIHDAEGKCVAHLTAQGTHAERERLATLLAEAPTLGAVLMRLARSADALLGLVNAATPGTPEARAACRDIADAHSVIQAAGLAGGAA